MGRAGAGDKAESSYERLLAEFGNTGQGIDRLGQKISQSADLSDKIFARRLLLLRFWLAGLILGVAAAIGALALAGVFS